MSTKIEVSIRMNQSMGWRDTGPSTLATSPEPIIVDITVPDDLIEMAKRYPSIDWNAVMRVALVTRGGGQ